MSAFWSGTVAQFLDSAPDLVIGALSREQLRRFRGNEVQQLRAWEQQVTLLRRTLVDLPEALGWRLLLEYPVLRLGKRIDAVLVADRAVFVIEFKVGATGFAAADLAQVDDYALDLHDFHAGSRAHPIVPVLVATDAVALLQSWPLLLPGVSVPVRSSGAGLKAVLRGLHAALPPGPTIDGAAWEAASYRPVPTIVEAARSLYAAHTVADLAAARADAPNLTRTTAAMLEALREARADGRKLAVFVTGMPGAGKTLCGLNAVFGAGRESGAVFLTGNPTLVHVLREALARDAAGGVRGALRLARQRTESAIQALPLFRDFHLDRDDPPPEHVIVVDEAQRSWAREHAVAKTRDRRVQLRESEPAHLLDIMGRHPDWAAIVCLVGGGQEIHRGEGGLAEWGAALATRRDWSAIAAPDTLHAADPRQRLPAGLRLRTDPALHLHVPIRSIRNPAAASWVDAVLAGEAGRARAIAADGIPFLLTRDLDHMRRTLRAACRGTRRPGLLASSGAARLRADGLGVELPHMDAGAVARWFLDRWPDVRASDALEVVATEFSCQGLELDVAGLCWGGDLVRTTRDAWTVRSFRGTGWTLPQGAEEIANRINSYRVLLTRARYSTVIWVPAGDPHDRTRSPRELDGVFDFLLACGARRLDAAAVPAAAAAPAGLQLI